MNDINDSTRNRYRNQLTGNETLDLIPVEKSVHLFVEIISLLQHNGDDFEWQIFEQIYSIEHIHENAADLSFIHSNLNSCSD